jgi:hypothetical protein
VRKSASRNVLLPLLGALAIALAMPCVAAAGEKGKPNDPLNAPTFRQQSRDWTSTQLAAYNSKLQEMRDLAGGKAVSATLPQCPLTLSVAYTLCGPPGTYYAHMTVVWEGSADCACGPATATEMFSTLTYYYNSPAAPGFTLSQVESQMGFSCSAGTYRYQLVNELNGHQSANTYVWQNVGSASDVHYYTQVDLGSYQIPVAYDGETFGPDGHPLDKYPNVDWKHYFPAYGCSPGYLTVDDPHFAASHTYTDRAVYLFIDNFPYTNQVLW